MFRATAEALTGGTLVQARLALITSFNDVSLARYPRASARILVGQHPRFV